MRHDPPFDILRLAAETRQAAVSDPFGSPALALALLLSRRMDDGGLSRAELAQLLRDLGQSAFRDRAARLREAVGVVPIAETDQALTALATRIARPDPQDSPVRFAAFAVAAELSLIHI